MRRKNKEIPDKLLIEAILKDSFVCRIGMKTEDVPYIVPVNYGYENGCIYVHSAPEGRKIELLEKDNKVSFEIEYDYEVIKEGESCDWTTKFRSLMGIGTVTIINDYDEKIKGLDIIMKQHGKMENSYNKKLVNNMVILKLAIEQVTGKQSGNWD